MKVRDNVIFKTAINCRGNCKVFPEAVILSYSKLLSMDENQVRNIVADADMGDLDVAHKWFSENRLDLSLIKSGLLLLLPVLPSNEAEVARCKGFEQFLESEAKEGSSAEILDAALEMSYIDFEEIFAVGKDMESIFAYQSELKAEKLSEEAERKENNEDSAQELAEDEPEEQEENEPENEPEEQPVKEAVTSRRTRKKKVEEPIDINELAEKYRKLNYALMDVVKGQDHAITKFVQGYNQGELLKNQSDGKQPKTYYFFFGPPGVGKTLMAETAAIHLGLPFKIFNMSEYSSSQSFESLIGVGGFYSGAKDGSLTKFVKDNPECVLVFDEIEKAHISTIRLFLQILGAGKLSSGFTNNEVSFSKATIIFTSNVGKSLYQDRSVNLTTMPERVIIDAITKETNAYGEPVLPLEMCSRIASGNTIMFNHLSIRHLAGMVNTNFEKIVMGMEKEYGVNVTYSKYLPLLFLYNRGGDIDARVATGQSGKFLKDEIYELLRQFENSKTKAKIKAIDIDVDWDGMDPELKRLFKNDSATEILFFGKNPAKWENLLGSELTKIYATDDIDEARKLLKKDITAVFIDPFYGVDAECETIWSIADYNTNGVRLFHEIVETQPELPVYMIETEGMFSDVDRCTFIQEGAAGTTVYDEQQETSFAREFGQIIEEIYMERESQAFSQRGWVIDFGTRQQNIDENGRVQISFYNLKKRRAIDVDSRGSILADAERPNISFDDVIGASMAKDELKQFVKFLQHPKQYISEGSEPPKGVLLYGPPGTGKTMLAKAMAGESDVSFIQTSATEFMNKYVGGSEENIRKIFAKAKKYAPSIIFIDEIDAIGKKRVGGDNAAHTETMLNALLTEMDGFLGKDLSKPVFVLAATNYGISDDSDGIAKLDEALMRRFDNRIYVELPKEEDRKVFLHKALAKKKIDNVDDSIIDNIAERTAGQSLAILGNVVELAVRNAIKESRKVNGDDLLTALEDYVYGEKKEHTLEYYKSVAIHETGHAYMAYISGDKPSYITIESRGKFGGYMLHANTEEKTEYTKEEIIARIRCCLAGRAAEQVFYGKEKSLNTGAGKDLENATFWAFEMLCDLGMVDDNLIVLNRKEVLNSTLAADYVRKANEILNTEMKNTIQIIESAKATIQRIADALVKENRLTGKQFEELMNNE